jgi:hypothetical protein
MTTKHEQFKQILATQFQNFELTDDHAKAIFTYDHAKAIFTYKGHRFNVSRVDIQYKSFTKICIATGLGVYGSTKRYIKIDNIDEQTIIKKLDELCVVLDNDAVARKIIQDRVSNTNTFRDEVAKLAGVPHYEVDSVFKHFNKYLNSTLSPAKVVAVYEQLKALKVQTYIAASELCADLK